MQKTFFFLFFFKYLKNKPKNLYPENLLTLIFLKNFNNKTKKPLSKKTKSAFFKEI